MIAAVFGIVIGAGGGIGGFLAGVMLLSEKSPNGIMIAWDVIIGAFLVFWMIGIITEIQRSETIDISRIMHLPVSLKNIFLVNYLASHLTLSIIVFLPWMLGLSVGLIFGKSWLMIWMLPLVLTFIFMITAWTYCLRGWLATLMVNKRRRRAVIAGITFTFILLCQLPNIFMNVRNDHRRHRPNTTETKQSDQQTTTKSRSNDKATIDRVVLAAHNYVPFLWTANGARALAKGNAWPAVFGAAGMFVIGGLGLTRAYRTTFRFYHGKATSKNISEKLKIKKDVAVRKNPLERQLPYVPQEAAALSLAFFRSFMRAPEVKMALATNVIMLLIFGSIFLFRRSTTISANFKPFVATGAIMFTFFGMSQLMFNQFGFDRDGFRKLVLLPVPRKYILLGKNLAILPISIGMGLILLALVKVALGVSLIIVIANVFQLVAAFFLLSMMGNLISVLIPHRIAPGTLKSTKTSTMMTLLVFVSHLLMPIAMIPIFLPPALGLLWSNMGWLSPEMTILFFSIVLLALLVFFYRLSLPSLGNLLQQREIKILQVVTKEVE